MSQPYWIALGDIHDNCERLGSIPGLDKAAGVIITGDMTLAGGTAKAASVLAHIAAVNTNIMAQIGNMDRPEVTGMLEEKGWNIHVESREISPGIVLMGLGCSPFTPFGTPSEHPDSRLAKWLETTHRKAPPHVQLILATHTPPYNTACDVIPDGTHVGSKAVREFIEDVQPALCLCGHIHEARSIDTVGRTTVVNPGAFVSGGYIYITLVDGQLRAELRDIPE